MKSSVIIPAGGIGKRFGSQVPKQFVDLAGIPILVHTIRIFDTVEDVVSIVIAVHNEWFTYTKEIVEKYKCEKVKEIIIGGQERQDSVFNGLLTETIKNSEIVLVHDAVRPFASPKLVQTIISETEDFGAVIPGIPPKETVKEVNNKGLVVKTLERNKLSLIQTPQGFWTDIITSAYRKAKEASFIGTDEASLVEFIGYKVTIVDGEDENIKITTPFDLKVAELIMQEKLQNK
jgi:2-C-methyl-D-erythritol 4-phosphate cytidylyltransferase